MKLNLFKMKNTIIISILFLITISSCRNKFITNAYEQRKFNHRDIAVIPLVSKYTGNIPDEITQDDIAIIEDAQSERFQELIHSRLVVNSGIGRNRIAVNLVSPSITNAKLALLNISLREASVMDPILLAQKLEVDAIVRGNVTMNRFISDLSSLKIQTAEKILRQVVSLGNFPVNLPGTGNLSRTYKIESSLEILDGINGSVLWKTNLLRNADWNYQPEDAIASMAQQYAQYFPYRNREFKKK